MGKEGTIPAFAWVFLVCLFACFLDIASRYPTLWTEQVKSRQNKTNKSSGKIYVVLTSQSSCEEAN